MAYHFYLGTMLCPVAPSQLDVKVKGKNKTQTLINEGEINVLKEAGLTEVQFDLLLPNVSYPFATYKDGYKNAKHFLDIIEKLKTDNKPFQFMVTRTMPNGKLLFDTNMKVSLEDYTIKEDRKEGFDVVVQIKLKEYRDYGTKTYTLDTAQLKKPRASANTPSNSATGTKYIVQSGDCLWNIARAAYGDGTKGSVIYEANKATIENAAKAHGRASSSNGHWIYTGTELVIPNSTEANLIVEKLGSGGGSLSGGSSSGSSSGSSANTPTTVTTTVNSPAHSTKMLTFKETKLDPSSNGNKKKEGVDYYTVTVEAEMPRNTVHEVVVTYTDTSNRETTVRIKNPQKITLKVKCDTTVKIVRSADNSYVYWYTSYGSMSLAGKGTSNGKTTFTFKATRNFDFVTKFRSAATQSAR